MNTLLPYRQNVCMLVFKYLEKDPLFFLGQRLGDSPIWQFPQGGIEEDDTIENSVYRELEEELGCLKEYFQIIARLNHTHQYDFKNPPAYALNKYRGQSQSFWLVKFCGSDQQINLSAAHPEFGAFQWCKAEAIHQIADPIRVPGYRGAISEALQILSTNNI